MKQLFALCGLLICGSMQAQSRFDTLDVRHYGIHLGIDITAKTITGYTEVTVKPKVNNVGSIALDLLKLTVDSVKKGTGNLVFQYNDTLLRISPPSALNMGDSIVMRIYYHGTPVTDATWGGFYFSGVYAFNLGVGFAANPNSYGRVWYPCLDDFRSRSSHDYYITADSVNKVFCNGLLQSVTNAGGMKKTWYWKETKPTPVYLSSVAMAPYASITWTYKSRVTNKDIPVVLNALPADTAKVRASFKNLDSALHIFEDVFGPYPFDRVGYNVVPFNGGAMEHTGNIAYPMYGIDGTLAYETTMAHELSHSWFGGLTDCSTSADMWLNEGWAAYSEQLFTERMYGHRAYKEEVRSNHRYVLQFAHLAENGYRAVAGIPHQYTYGTHVYKKGSDVAHAMRGYYYTDADFFSALKASFNANPFGYRKSDDLKTLMQTANSGDMNAFFNNWVYAAGFPQFSIYNWKVISQGGGSYTVEVAVRQRLAGTETFYTSVPLDIACFGSNWQRYNTKVVVSGFETNATFTIPFAPAYVALDMEERISDAITDQYKVLRQNDSVDYGDALMKVKVNTSSDSALLRVEHNWVGADQLYCHIPGLYVSNYRHWTVDGLWPVNFSATAYITYDGRKPVSLGGTGYLDHTFIRKTEDSLVLVYRPNGSSNWQIYTDAVITTGGKNDKFGNIRINNLKKGQYALAMYDVSLGEKPLKNSSGSIRVYPNPTDGFINVELLQAHAGGTITITDMQGREHASLPYSDADSQLKFPVGNMAAGIYILQVLSGSAQVFSTRIAVQ